MIEDGDRVAVGLSGGKDSLVLLAALQAYRKYSPERFELFAVRIDMGFKNADAAEVRALAAYVESLGVPYHVEQTDLAEIIFDVRKEKNPCSLCSKMRRGALNTVCGKIGANKLALGHHREDVLETFLLSMMYEGRLSTFQPKSYLSRSGITVIRPLIYAAEGDLSGAARRYNLPVLHNPCPADRHTQREYMKSLVGDIAKAIPIAKDRMCAAIMHPERYNLFPPKGDINAQTDD